MDNMTEQANIDKDFTTHKAENFFNGADAK
jgi:hypothetical protein